VTISFVAIGAISATADTATPFTSTSYPLPTGAAADDLLTVAIGSKPFGSTPGVPGGWTQQASVANGSTAVVTDGGSVRAGAYTRTMVGGDVAPSFTWSVQYNPQYGVMLGLRKTNAGSWTVGQTTGTDTNTASTAFSAAGGATLAWTAGDWAVAVVVTPTDAGTFTSPSLTIPGCTVGTLTQRVTTPGTAQGADLSLYIYTAEITAGTASGVPTFAATGTSGATGSAQGAVVFLRAAEPVASSGATVTPATVTATAAVPTPIVTTAAAAAMFRLKKAGGGSRLRAGDQLRLGATTTRWAILSPATVAARAAVGLPSLWGPPLGVTATPVSASRIDLEWLPVATATGYDVERDGSVIAINVAATSYVDTGLATASTHSYRVRAVRV
jgi:hypothetical protein